MTVGSTLRVTELSTRSIFLGGGGGVKVRRADNRANSCAKFWEPQPLGALSPSSRITKCVISDFRRDVDTLCGRLSYYARTPKNSRISWPLKMEQIGCPQTSVLN